MGDSGSTKAFKINFSKGYINFIYLSLLNPVVTLTLSHNANVTTGLAYLRSRSSYPPCELCRAGCRSAWCCNRNKMHPERHCGRNFCRNSVIVSDIEIDRSISDLDFRCAVEVLSCNGDRIAFVSVK